MYMFAGAFDNASGASAKGSQQVVGNGDKPALATMGAVVILSTSLYLYVPNSNF